MRCQVSVHMAAFNQGCGDKGDSNYQDRHQLLLAIREIIANAYF